MLIRKIASFVLIITFVFLQLPFVSLATQSTALSNEFTKVYTNTDLSQTVEISPYSLFTQNADTLAWERKQNILLESGLVSYVSHGEPESNFSSVNEVKVGLDSNDQFETFIKFGHTLPDLNGGLFLGAKLRLKELQNDNNCYYCQTYNNEEFSIHKILEPWNAHDLTWSNKPDVLETPITNRTLAMPVGGGYYGWDVSQLVLDWYKNPAEDFGLALKATAIPNSSPRTFSKLNNDLQQMPALQIQYSPKPEAPIGISTGLQANSERGIVNLQWSSVTGTNGYRVYLYNGETFEQVYEGTQTRWSSLGKNLWPTNEQITKGEFNLRQDGSGTDFSDKPGFLYQRLGDREKSADTYYFKISAFNNYGETDFSEVTAIKMPDTSAPTIPKNIRATNELISNFSLTWDPSVDQSSVVYHVKVTNEAGYPIFSGTTNTNSLTIPNQYLTEKSLYNVTVQAVDQSSYQSNYSAYSSAVAVTARKQYDAQLINMSYPSSIQDVNGSPTVKVVLKNVGTDPWTQNGGYVLKANGTTFTAVLAPKEIIRSGEIKTFEYKLPTDMPIGTSQFSWRMFNQNFGYFGDTSEMSIHFEKQSIVQNTNTISEHPSVYSVTNKGKTQLLNKKLPEKTFSTIAGKTKPFSVVSIKIGSRNYSVKSNSSGNFKIHIPKQKAGTKLNVTSKGTNGKLNVPKAITIY